MEWKVLTDFHNSQSRIVMYTVSVYERYMLWMVNKQLSQIKRNMNQMSYILKYNQVTSCPSLYYRFIPRFLCNDGDIMQCNDLRCSWSRPLLLLFTHKRDIIVSVIGSYSLYLGIQRLQCPNKSTELSLVCNIAIQSTFLIGSSSWYECHLC